MKLYYIYEIVGRKVGCTSDLKKRVKLYEDQEGTNPKFQILEHMTGTKQEAGDREHWWADKLGYSRGSHYNAGNGYQAGKSAQKGGFAVMSKLTREQRQEQAKYASAQRYENSTPEQRRDTMLRSWKTRRATGSGVTNHNNLGSKWINDGAKERRLPAGEALPNDWMFGQLKSNRKPSGLTTMTPEKRSEAGRIGAMRRWHPTG